jgi:hypothetical protein
MELPKRQKSYQLCGLLELPKRQKAGPPCGLVIRYSPGMAERTMAWAVFFLIYFPPQAALPTEMNRAMG